MTERSATPTLFIRCAGLHSRGELLHEFFYAHRAALGLEPFYEVSNSAPGSSSHQDANADAVPMSAKVERASSPRLPADFPVEVVYVRQSRKPYFLVEWRYPTKEELERQKTVDDDSAYKEKVRDSPTQEAVPPTAESNASSSQKRLPSEFLAQLAERTLSLGKKDESEGGLMWRGQPVMISVALAGMMVATERTKLELRDAQLKTQRVAEKRVRDQVEATSNEKGKSSEADQSTPSFVPRSVRRRA
ncbi:hypothetical protein ABL78_4033 [Leptomonas seymouri]|uniref:Uncharacterized protein n=1 Tax=Leptomonas seymouri TaxID=5684 RepID=A0A0N0P5V4_LEPSE|nr:hypothetical protein ABL78_4033 [Leptomonas seymouri]|eukprot:KPI86899.1 hypothetical protein ABL78_4033 [Leptomonas seymouri]